MISFENTGSFGKTESFLARMTQDDIRRRLEAGGKMGVQALSAATPIDSGQTASSWSYEISGSRGELSITWTNSHVEDGVPIAIILQYGHGTGTGGYVQGRDYINPAMKPIFDRIADDVWKAVTSA